MRGAWPTTTCGSLPSANRTCAVPASGSRRLFAGLHHELRHCSACSWLAGKAFASISRAPVAVAGSVGGSNPLRANTRFSICLARIRTYASPSLRPHFRRFLATAQYSDSLSRSAFGLPHFCGCAARSGSRLTRAGPPIYPGHPSRHAISADTARGLDRPRRMSSLPLTVFAGQVSALAPWLNSFRCSLDGVHLSLIAFRFQKMPHMQFRPRDLIPDISFGR